MINKNIHIVILSKTFAEQNIAWMEKFVFYNEEKNIYFFSCISYAFQNNGFVFFEVHHKSNVENLKILLPVPSIEGILLDEFHKNQLGFVCQ